VGVGHWPLSIQEREASLCKIIIGQAQLEEALQLRFGAKVRGILRNARAFTEGRWLFIPVESEQDCRDVEHLLRVRANPLKKTKSVM